MEQIYITDVSPRDGLQNQALPVDTQAKLQLIRLLAAAGVGSSPRRRSSLPWRMNARMGV